MRCAKCDEETEGNYKYCTNCYKDWIEKHNKFKENTNQWSENPIVDVLLKINSNLFSIAVSLKQLEEIKKLQEAKK